MYYIGRDEIMEQIFDKNQEQDSDLFNITTDSFELEMDTTFITSEEFTI